MRDVRIETEDRHRQRTLRNSEDIMATTATHHGESAPIGTAHTLPAVGVSEQRVGVSAEILLSELGLGTAGRVVGLLEDAASGPIIKRLSNLGFVPGRIVTPLRRAPLGDPVVYRVADYELCLRHHEARIVRVEAVTDADVVVETETVTAIVDGRVASAEPATEPAGEEQDR